MEYLLSEGNLTLDITRYCRAVFALGACISEYTCTSIGVLESDIFGSLGIGFFRWFKLGFG